MEADDAASLTTVIATYNRRHCIEQAVRSALAALPHSPVIVVDDASEDDTLALLRQRCADELADGRLQLVALPANRGVTAAKNAGYARARTRWVVFLDSDDRYLEGCGSALQAELHDSAGRPIVFFRCQDEAGCFVGTRQGQRADLPLRDYLVHTSHGEALTAVNKALVRARPYPASLRGYEGLGCARIIARHGPARLAAVVARVYDQRGEDRLSSRRAMFRRMPLLARGHLAMAREFRREMPAARRLRLFLVAAAYMLAGRAYAALTRT